MTEKEKVEKAAKVLLCTVTCSGSCSLNIMSNFTIALLQEKIEEHITYGMEPFFNRMITRTQEIVSEEEDKPLAVSLCESMVLALVLRFPEQLVGRSEDDSLFLSILKKRIITDNISPLCRCWWVWGITLGTLSVLRELKNDDKLINFIPHSFANVVVAPFFWHLMVMANILKMGDEARLSNAVLALSKENFGNLHTLVVSLAMKMVTSHSSLSEFGLQMANELSSRYWQTLKLEGRWRMIETTVEHS